MRISILIGGRHGPRFGQTLRLVFLLVGLLLPSAPSLIILCALNASSITHTINVISHRIEGSLLSLYPLTIFPQNYTSLQNDVHPHIIIMSTYRLLLLSVSLLLEFYSLHHSSTKRSKKMQLLHQILELVPAQPHQIIRKFASQIATASVEICKGKIHAGETCSAMLNSAYKVVFSKLVEGEFGLRFSRQKILRVKQPSFLQVRDDLSSLNIFETHKSVVMPTKMLCLKPKYEMLSKITNKFKQLFHKMEDPIVNNEGYSYFGGESLRELVLPEGSDCAILGKFVKEGGKVNCYEPLLIAPSKERMIAVLQQDLLSQKILSVLLKIGAGITIVLLLRELWQLTKKLRSKSSDLFDKLNRILLTSRVCQHCKKNLSCMLSRSCLHMNVCRDCCSKEGESCLECNKKIKDYVEIFAC